MRFLAVEGPGDALDAVRAELMDPSRYRSVTVHDPDTAQAAVRAALGGQDLLIHATAGRLVLDRLYDDLRRLGTVEIRTAADASATGRLSDEEVALLRLLAAGSTLGEAADQLHVSPRTADRRLAAAKAKLGAATTAQAVASLKRPREG